MKLRISRGACLFGGAVLLVTLLSVARAGEERHAILMGHLGDLVPVLCAVLVHESGHILTARLCGMPLSVLCVDLFGARLRLGGLMSYRRELLVAAAGPLANLLSAGALLLACLARGVDLATVTGEEGWLLFVVASLGLAAVNLLPVRTLDGGRILHCALSQWFGTSPADTVLALTTTLAATALWLLSVYALLRAGEMLSLFVFSLCLLLRMLEGKDTVV